MPVAISLGSAMSVGARQQSAHRDCTCSHVDVVASMLAEGLRFGEVGAKPAWQAVHSVLLANCLKRVERF